MTKFKKNFKVKNTTGFFRELNKHGAEAWVWNRPLPQTTMASLTGHLQHRAELLWQGTQGCSCKVGSHPTTYSLHAMGFKTKKKITASHHLTSAKPRCSGLLWFPEHRWQGANLGHQPQHTQGTHDTALPTVPCQQMWSYTQGCPHMAEIWLYRPCWQVRVEPSWLLRENFACMISSSVVPTYKYKALRLKGLKSASTLKYTDYFIELLLLYGSVHFKSPQKQMLR